MEVDGSCWRRGSLIGRGAFGSVFLARRIDYYSHDDHLPQLFAVKSANFLKASSIHSEFKTLINLQDSPYIIRCYGEEVTAGNDGHSALNLLMEYAAGGSLSCHIKESVGLPEPQVKWLMVVFAREFSFFDAPNHYSSAAPLRNCLSTVCQNQSRKKLNLTDSLPN